MVELQTATIVLLTRENTALRIRVDTLDDKVDRMEKKLDDLACMKQKEEQFFARYRDEDFSRRSDAVDSDHSFPIASSKCSNPSIQFPNMQDDNSLIHSCKVEPGKIYPVSNNWEMMKNAEMKEKNINTKGENEELKNIKKQSTFPKSGTNYYAVLEYDDTLVDDAGSKNRKLHRKFLFSCFK